MAFETIPYKNGVKELLKREKVEDEIEKNKVALPPITNPNDTFAVRLKTNPFSLPPGNAWIDLWKEEKRKERDRRKSERKKKVHLKHTFSTRSAYSTLPAIKQMCRNFDSELALSDSDSKGVSASAKVCRVRPVQREFTHEFIKRKREFFLSEFALQTKREEVEKHKTKALEEDLKVVKQMERLHEDAVLFDDFLKATDDAAVEAMKVAEKETKLKLDKIAEIRKCQARLMSLKSEISKDDEILSEYLGFKSFLARVNYNSQNKDSLPIDCDQWAARREAQRLEFIRKRDQKSRELAEKDQKHSRRRFNRLQKTSHPQAGDRAIGKVDSKQGLSKTVYPEEWEDDETRMRIYQGSPIAQTPNKKSRDSTRGSKRKTPTPKAKKDGPILDELGTLSLENPKLLLDIIHEYEEKNLDLIYRYQRSEDELEELRNIQQSTIKHLSSETQHLKSHVQRITRNIQKCESKADEHHLMCVFLTEGNQERDSKVALNLLTGQVEVIYRKIFTFAIGTTDALLMLTSIEQKMNDLLELVDSLPQGAVKEAQKAKDRERRVEMREEKAAIMKRKQEERMKKALKRANAASFKRTGRKLMFRSKPLTAKAKKKSISSTSVESLDFFTY